MCNANNQPTKAEIRGPVETYESKPTQRPGSVRALFNGFARHYDLVNQIFSLGSGAWYRRRCLRQAGVGPGAVVIDVAMGTGLLALEAQRLMHGHGILIGVDLSESMLAEAQKSLQIPMIQGAAEALPLADEIADFVTMGYALRHLADTSRALREAHRLLRPGGKLVLLEISPPRSPAIRVASSLLVGHVLPGLSALIARNREAKALMDYHWQTIATYAPPPAVLDAMHGAGFQAASCASEFDFFRFYSALKLDS